MPVSISSLIPARMREAAAGVVAADSAPADLVAALADVADPRARRGVRHRCATVLALGVCAVLAGAKTFIAIGEWAADLTPTVRHRLELGRRAHRVSPRSAGCCKPSIPRHWTGLSRPG